MRSWLSIRVELIQGGGRTLWPRPGRVFAAARSHTFLQLSDAIDTAFACWDRAHLDELLAGVQAAEPHRAGEHGRVGRVVPLDRAADVGRVGELEERHTF